MRILYASERPPYPFFLGGAARCAHRLLYGLTEDLAVECVAVGSSDYAVSPWSFPDTSEYDALKVRSVSADGREGTVDCGYPIKVFPGFPDSLGNFIEAFKPDVVWSQLEGALPTLSLARGKGIQGLYFVHDAEFDPAELRAIGELDCHIVCSSGFLAGMAGKVIGRRAQVVYPCPETDFGVEGDPDGHITMINPHRVKGLDTLIAIARRLPSERFLLVASWKLDEAALAALHDQLAEVPNVRFERRVSDMRLVYRETKLLLVPSVWEEGFGMVAVEAQSCGIPVIASARGGLPESVGDGGILIDDYRNADAWVDATLRVLGDASAYGEWSRRAFGHASAVDFAPQELTRRFLAACSAPAPAHRKAAGARVLDAARDRIRKIPALERILRRGGPRSL